MTPSTTDTLVKSSHSTSVDPKSNLDPSGSDEVSTDSTGAKIHAPTVKKEQNGTPSVNAKEV